MNWKGRASMAGTFMVMVSPKLIDEAEDFFDEDPATLFSWQFIMALLAAPVLLLVSSFFTPST
jgi:hypothetical protein